MLYASAREDLKRSLGPEFFLPGPDYHVTELSELSPKAFNEWKSRDAKEAMTNAELERAEVQASVEEHRSTLPMRMATLGAVPFKADEALVSALAAFKASAAPAEQALGSMSSDEGSAASTGVVNWMEIRVGHATVGGGGELPVSSPQPKASPVAGESITVGHSGPETEHVEVVNKLLECASAEPRFFLVKPTPPGNGAVLMVYHCPELSKPKIRMTYSTAKSALSEAAAAAGIPVARTVETSDRDDVSTAFVEFAASPIGTVGHAVESPGTAASIGAAGGPGSPVQMPGHHAAGGVAAPAAGMGSPITAGRKSMGVGLPGMGMALPGMVPHGLGGPSVTATGHGIGVGLPGMGHGPGSPAGAVRLPGLGGPAAAEGGSSSSSASGNGSAGAPGGRLSMGGVRLPGMGMALPGMAPRPAAAQPKDEDIDI